MSEEQQSQGEQKTTQAAGQVAGLLIKAGPAGWITLAVIIVLVLLALLLFFFVLVITSPEEEDASTTAASCVPGEGPNVEIPEEYEEAVEDAAAEAELPVSVVHALFDQESGYDPNAVSHANAGGIGQFTIDTWNEYGNGGDRFDPYDSIDATGRYLSALQDQVADVATTDAEQIKFMLAAYNAGPGAVQQYDGIPPYEETQDYVEIITSAAQVDYSEDCTNPTGSEVGDLGTGEWTHPLPDGDQTSSFGPRPCPAGTECNEYTANHHGVDFASGGGSEVLAPTDIEITAAGVNQYQGEYVIGRMEDDADLVFQFHHCQHASTNVNAGDTVAVGTPLCTEGNTGNSSGAHLHFQINAKEADDSQPTYDHAIDPEPIMIEQGIL